MESSPEIKIRLSQKIVVAVFWTFLCADLFVACADLFFNHWEWIPYGPMQRFFDITREDGLANWLASTQFLVTAFCLGLIGIIQYYDRQMPANQDSAIQRVSLGSFQQWMQRHSHLGWWGMAAIFFGLAIDDAAKLHERLGTTFGYWVEDTFKVHESLPFFPSYNWQLVYAPILLGIGLYFATFLWNRLPGKISKIYLCFGVSILAFAIGLDFFEGMDPAVFEFDSARHEIMLIEEFLELLGSCLILTTFFNALVHQVKNIRIVRENPARD